MKNIKQVFISFSICLFINTGLLYSQSTIIGSTQTPEVIQNDTLFFYNTEKGALRGGQIQNLNWSLANLGQNSFAFGLNTRASGSQSFAMGQNNSATGLASFAFGSLVNATQSYSIAGGVGTLASGSAAVAFGQNSSATGQASISLGFDSDALASYALAAGQLNTASGSASVALGSQNTASATASTALGIQTQANGLYSLSAGRGTIAGSRSAAVFGRWNVGNGSPTQWMAGDPIFEVGNGSADNARNNAFTILKDGKIGVNTSTPELDLDILGGARMKNNSTTNAPQLLLHEESTNDYARIQLRNDNPETSWTIAARTNSDITSSNMNFYLDNVGNIMTLAGDKQVGVGTSSPTDRLHISANSEEAALRVQLGGLTKLRVQGNGGLSVGSNNPSGTPTNGMYVSGNVGIGKSSPTEKLEVNGAVVVGDTDGTKVGSVRYHNGDFEGYDGEKWVSLTKANIGWGEVDEPTNVTARNSMGAPISTLDFGIDIASQGQWMIVGAPAKSTPFMPGRAYMYKGGGYNWTEHQVIDAPNDKLSFGARVDINGNWAIVGNLYSDTATVLELSGDTWSISDELTSGSNPIKDVVIRANTAAVVQDDDFSDRKRIYFYEYNNGWNFDQTLSFSATILSLGGDTQIDMNESGDVLVVSSEREDVNGLDQAGAVYIYRRNNGLWSFEQKLTASIPKAEDLFGKSIAISGNSIAVGIPGEDAVFTNQGAVVIFDYSNGSWSQDALILSNQPSSFHEFGQHLDFSGNFLVAVQKDDGFQSEEAPIVTVYHREGQFWPFKSQLNPNENIDGESYYGFNVSINNNTIIVGSNRRDPIFFAEDAENYPLYFFCR